jgi:hypothetical protein
MTENMKDLFRRKAMAIPIKIFLMEPNCDSRRDRYRIEPLEAALKMRDAFVEKCCFRSPGCKWKSRE